MYSKRAVLFAIVVVFLCGACGGTDDGTSGDDDNGTNVEGEPKGEVGSAPNLVENRPEILQETPSFISEENLETTFDVEWTSDTTVVKSSQMGALKDYDWQNQVYTFDASAAESAGLKIEAGRVLMLSGLTVRRIASVEKSGDEWTVRTRPATLTDAIKNGTVGAEYQPEFTNEMFKHTTMKFRKATVEDGLVTVGKPLNIDTEDIKIEIDQENGNVSYSFSVKQYNYHMEFSLEGDRFRTAFNVTKEGSSGKTVRFGVSGYVDAPTQKFNADIQEQEVQRFNYNTGGLSGELTLSIAAAGAGKGGASFPLPSPIFKFPLRIGPVPVTIEMGAKLSVELDVPDASEASAQIENTFKFGSDIGLEYAGADVKTSSSLGTAEIKDGSIDLASKFDAIEAGMALGFPRFKLSLAYGSASVSVQHVTFLKGILKTGPICQKAEIEMYDQAGYDLSVLGLSFSDTEKFNEKDGEELQDTCEGR